MSVSVDLDYDGGARSPWLPTADVLVNWLNYALAVSAGAENKPEQSVNVSVRLVDHDQALALNRQYCGKNKPTNVLSFPAQLPETVTKLMEYTHLGDIVICPGVVEQEAQDQQKPLQAHWAHMAIHGFLHLQGYDHASSVEAATMEALEILVLEKLGFSNPYLIG